MALVTEYHPELEKSRDAAISYAHLGWRVLPTRFKVPTLARWPEKATTNESTIARWFPPHEVRSSKAGTTSQNYRSGVGLGIATGKASNLIVLDIDTHKGGRVLETLEDLIGGRVPITPTVKTGSGGLHYYFQYPGAQVTHLRNSVEKLGKGIDIRGDGGFVCAPPSPHPSGNSYLWLVRPQDAPLAKLPTSLLEMLMNFPTSVNSKAPVESTAINSTAIYLPGEFPQEAEYWLYKALEKAPGKRNDTGLWLACQLRDEGLSFTQASYVMDRYAVHVQLLESDHGYSRSEAVASLHQAYSRPARSRVTRVSLSITIGDATTSLTKATEGYAYSGNKSSVAQPTMYSGNSIQEVEAFVSAAVAADNTVEKVVEKRSRGRPVNQLRLAQSTAILELWSSLYSQKSPRVQRVQEWLNMVATAHGGRYKGHEAEALARFIVDLDGVHHFQEDETPAAYVEKSLCVECGVAYREKPKRKAVEVSTANETHQDGLHDMPFSLAGVA